VRANPIVRRALKLVDQGRELRLLLGPRHTRFPVQEVHHPTHLVGILLHAGEHFLLVGYTPRDESLESLQQTPSRAGSVRRGQAFQGFLHLGQRRDIRTQVVGKGRRDRRSRSHHATVSSTMAPPAETGVFRRARRNWRRRQRRERSGRPVSSEHFRSIARTPDFGPHFRLRRAVQVKNGLRQVAKKVVLAIPVRHPAKFRGNALEKGVLLVRNPKHDVQTERSGQVFGADKQFPDFGRRARQQGVGKPDAVAGYFADNVERLMPLLRLQAVDRQHDFARVAIHVLQDLRILMPRGDHVLVRGEVVFEGVVRQTQVVAIEEFAPNLRHGPMPGKTSLADPAEDVPTDSPTRHGNLRLLLGTEEFPASASFVAALHELDV
jgi:hypothetical protein